MEDHQWRVVWGLIRASAAGCLWAADTGADSGERPWEELHPSEVASVAEWEWEVAASAAAWVAGWEADTEEGVAATDNTASVRARTG
jgi:hypothetical protein